MSAIEGSGGAGGSPSIQQQPQDDQPAASTVADAPSSNAPDAATPAPGQTLAEMARQQPYPAALMTAASTTSGEPPAAPPGRPDDVDMARMANDVYATPDPKTGEPQQTQSKAALDSSQAQWKRADDAKLAELGIDPATLNDPATGFQAAVYVDKDDRYVVAFAGTDSKSMGDWKNNAQQAYGFEAQQYDQARRLAKTMADKVGADNVSFAGHSLGGGLAQVATVATDSYGVTFNAAGLSDGTIRGLGMDPDAVREEFSSPDRMRSYSVDGDPLTSLNGHVGTPEALGAKYSVPADGEMNPIAMHGGGGADQHYVEGLEDGKVKPGEADSLLKQEAREVVHRVVDVAVAVVDAAKEVVRNTVDKVKETTNRVVDGVRDLAAEGKKVLDKLNPFGWSW